MATADGVQHESQGDDRLLERLFGLTGGGSGSVARSQLFALGLLVTTHLVLEMGAWAREAAPRALAMRGVVAVALLSLGLQLAPWFLRRRSTVDEDALDRARSRAAWAMPIMVAAALGMHALLFPAAANHAGLLALVFVVLATFDVARDEEALAARATLRWLTVIVLFSTGLQKVLYGTYFHGDFLAWQLAHDERFLSFLQFTVSGEEIERLRRLADGATDLGTYRSSDPMLLVASNVAYLGELALPFALVWKRTRAWAIPAAFALFILIEAGARELFFGVLFLNLLLLFAEQDWLRRLAPISIALYLAAFASRMGWLPGWNLN